MSEVPIDGSLLEDFFINLLVFVVFTLVQLVMMEVTKFINRRWYNRNNTVFDKKLSKIKKNLDKIKKEKAKSAQKLGRIHLGHHETVDDCCSICLNEKHMYRDLTVELGCHQTHQFHLGCFSSYWL